jgi:hypothetical protein
MPSRRYNPNPTTPSRGLSPGAWLAVVLAALTLAAVGCGEQRATSLIDQIEHSQVNERLVELELGEFAIPISAPYLDEHQSTRNRSVMLLRFELWGLVSPRQAAASKRIAARNAGTIRDRVITTCRAAAVGDLQDPNLTALRSRMLDSIQPLFEGHMLRRVFVTEVLSDPI